MLKKLRKEKIAKKILIALAIIIIPAFVFWGLGSAVRSQKEMNYAGKILNKKVSFLEYKDALDAVREQAIMRFGDNYSEMKKYLNLEEQAWERLILLGEAKIRKINASDSEVVELIRSYPFFQRKAKFDNKIYSQMLQYVFHSQPRLFEEHTRQNIMFAKLYNQVTEDVKASQEEIKEDYRKANEELSIYYIASQPAEFSKDIVLSEKDIKDYFTKNYLDFKQPVSFNLDYIAVESEEKIKEVFSSLNKKNDLDKIAKGLNLTIKETGFFAQTDPIPGIGWSPEILNLISKLKAGEYSAPVKVDKNYYVFKLRERKEAYIPEFEKVEDKVKEGLIKVKSEEIAKNRIDECLKKLKETYQKNLKSVDFNKLAKEFGLKSNSTNLFKYGSYIEGIGASDIFWTQAKDLKENDFSEVIDMPSGFYILRLKSRVPVDEKKFEAEKENFSQQLLSQKKQEYFAKFIKELSRRSGITPPLK